MNIRFNPNIKPLKLLKNSGIAMLIAAGGFAAAGISDKKTNNVFYTSPQTAGTIAALGLCRIAAGLKRKNDDKFEISNKPIREITEEEFQSLKAEIEKKKVNLNANNKNILNHIPLNDYNIQCIAKIVDSNKLFGCLYNSLYFNDINSAKFFDYMLRRKDEIKEKLGDEFIFSNVHRTVTNQKDLDFKIELLNYGLKNPETCGNVWFADIMRNSRNMDEAVSMLMHLKKYGVLPEKRRELNNKYGESFTSKLLNEISYVKEKFNIDFEDLQEYANSYREPYIIIRTAKRGADNDTIFRFDPKTAELITFENNNKLYNLKNNSVTILTLKKIKKNKNAFLDSKKLLRAEFETFDLSYGSFIRKSGYNESKIRGEFENTEITEAGKVYKNGLAEIDKNKGEHIEKHLTSPDGTVTDYIFANDKKGNRYFYYKITDENGKVLYETTKNFKVLSENHFQSSADGINYDIVFDENKVRVKKSGGNNETAEYKLKDFTKEDYKNLAEEIRQCEQTPIILQKLAAGEITLGEIALDKKIFDKYTADKRLIKVLKNLSGEEWFALKHAEVYALISDNEKGTAHSLGKCIQLGKENLLLSIIEHETGHEKARALNLNDDEKLKKIYEKEKALFTTSLPDIAVCQAGYFLRNIIANGLSETTAEANLIINAPSKWKDTGSRTMFLQQYFPKTIAYIANRYKELA